MVRNRDSPEGAVRTLRKRLGQTIVPNLCDLYVFAVGQIV